MQFSSVSLRASASVSIRDNFHSLALSGKSSGSSAPWVVYDKFPVCDWIYSSICLQYSGFPGCNCLKPGTYHYSQTKGNCFHTLFFLKIIDSCILASHISMCVYILHFHLNMHNSKTIIATLGNMKIAIQNNPLIMLLID